MRAGDVAAATRRLLRLPDLTHTDLEGRAHMVDVSDKAETDRVAVAGARVVMKPATLARRTMGRARLYSFNCTYPANPFRSRFSLYSGSGVCLPSCNSTSFRKANIHGVFKAEPSRLTIKAWSKATTSAREPAF